MREGEATAVNNLYLLKSYRECNLGHNGFVFFTHGEVPWTVFRMKYYHVCR